MEKPEIADLFKLINIAYPSFVIPNDADEMRRLLDGWYYYLSDVPYDQAASNLKDYALNPDNKYPPHPGALARTKTSIDKYFDHMREAGSRVLQEYESFKKHAAPPTEEQKRRVRELYGSDL